MQSSLQNKTSASVECSFGLHRYKRFWKTLHRKYANEYVNDN